MWNALTRFWRDRMTFNTAAPTVPPTAWMDLTQQAGSLLTYNVKDSDLVSLMLYHLVEPQLNAGLYVGSDMFVLADFTKALERRRNQFLLETGMVTTAAVVNGPAPSAGRLVLPDSVMDVRRAAWIDANGVFTTLWRSDEWAAEAFKNRWETSPSNPPQAYSTAVEPPVTLQLIPGNSDVGQVELVTVSSGASLNPTAGVLLGVPDDFAWVVKWGALADLLGREGQSKDTERAQYCEFRWKEGVALARIFTSVMAGYINGVEAFVGPVRSLDTYRAGWQNQTPAKPDTLTAMSWNLLAASPIPDAGAYSIMLDVVKNTPVPVNPTDQIQLGREELDVILDYAEHLAAFKQAGKEFMDSAPKYQNMIALAQLRNERLKKGIPFYTPLMSRATVQEREDPRREPVEAGS